MRRRVRRVAAPRRPRRARPHLVAFLLTLSPPCLLGLLATCACSSGDGSGLYRVAPDGAVTCAGPSLQAGDQTFTIKAGGLDRVYDVHVPSGYTGTAVPVVVFWHPLSQNKEYGKATMVPLSD